MARRRPRTTNGALECGSEPLDKSRCRRHRAARRASDRSIR